jgi:hydrogenase maturation protein HypF
MEPKMALQIHIEGLVQGVGFRPYIYRLAQRMGIAGWVENRNDGVRVHAEGPETKVQDFVKAIPLEAPSASTIRRIDTTVSEIADHESFFIKKSKDASEEITDISPDIAVCAACLEDMKTQAHRMGYPFINCTNCGPRFTIISDLPYDRDKTTMKVFPMCEICRSEYINILDRRFHAQPVACNDCGPKYTMATGNRVYEDIHKILQVVNREVIDGNVIAIKGLGGFHLACDAFNEGAVRTLRSRKSREGKPFAVMFRNLDSLKEYLVAEEKESEELTSWRRPILILKNRSLPGQLADAVSNGFRTTGAMLPYMPFHHLLFDALQTPAIVLTSGNISDEPILIDNQKALAELDKVADSFITYNRDILNRTDDSVAMVINDKLRMIRRSRGFVPSPIELGLKTEGIFASGAELVNCFCIGKGRQALLSQHIGDLKNLETLEFYEEAYSRFRKMYRFEPEIFAVDMHPDYLSRRFCEELLLPSAGGGRKQLTEVQHHHAHIASCMAEHGLDEEVIGVSLDGVGYGTDGNIWGFEFMTCDLNDFKRMYHPEYVPQPGGDLTTYEPWRMAVSYLHKVYGPELKQLPIPALKKIDDEKLSLVIEAIDKKINTPLTCSAGRLFDAVSALTGCCLFSDFHAEAPMRLEQIASDNENGSYDFSVTGRIETEPLIRNIVDDIINGTQPSIISAKFHNTILQIILETCLIIKGKTGLDKVVLSGGTFQNSYLLSRIEPLLRSRGLKPFTQEQVPSNDGGIALGQLAIAAKRRSLGMF